MAVLALGDLDQHALGEAALEVQQHHLARLADERHAAAASFCGRLGQQGAHLGLEQCFDAGGAGQEEGQGHR